MPSRLPPLLLALLLLPGLLRADTVTVGCLGTAGTPTFNYDSITAALNALRAKSSHDHVINVSGACTELIQIGDFQNLAIITTSGARIATPDPAQPALAILRSSNITMQGFLIEGAVNLFSRASALVDRCTIRGAPFALTLTDLSSANLVSSIIQNNAQGGIRLSASSILAIGKVSGDATPSIITANSGPGILAEDNSLVQVYGSTVISHNTGPGIRSFDSRIRLCCTEGQRQLLNNSAGVELTGGSARIDGPVLIKDSTGPGISAFGSTVALSGPALLEGNRSVAILLLGSSARVGGGSIIRANGSGLMSHGGITAARASQLRADGVQITDNNGQGIYIGENSMGVLSANTIARNRAEGVRVWRLSSAWLSSPPSTVTGNGGFDFFCTPDSLGFGTRQGVGRFFCPAFNESPEPSPDPPSSP